MFQESVANLVSKYPMIRNALGALESEGCKIDLSRHIACEMCNTGNLHDYQ